MKEKQSSRLDRMFGLIETYYHGEANFSFCWRTSVKFFSCLHRNMRSIYIPGIAYGMCTAREGFTQTYDQDTPASNLNWLYVE